jgi:dolichol kinase
MSELSQTTGQPITLKGELFRKLIHYSSAVIPIGYYFLDKKTVLYILVPILFLMIVFEILKYNNKYVYSLYTKFFSYLLREHEYDKRKIRINGATWLLIAFTICIFIFPKLIAITGMLLLSLSDSTSAIIGRVYGKKQYAPNRSIIGSVTFLVVGIIIIFATPKYFYLPNEYLIGIIAVTGTTLTDSLNLPTDDNFIIPVVSSVLLYVLYIIFFPGIF